MKEKTCVCIGIFLILALLCSCALFYGLSGSSAVAVRGPEAAESIGPGANLLSETSDSPLSVASPLFTASK